VTPQELLDWRKTLGINQREAAAAIGLSYRGYQKLEQGRAPIGERTRLAARQVQRQIIWRGGLRGRSFMFMVHVTDAEHSFVLASYLVIALHQSDARAKVGAQLPAAERQAQLTAVLTSDEPWQVQDYVHRIPSPLLPTSEHC